MRWRRLIKKLTITQRLESGAASHVEVLRLQRQKSDLGLKFCLSSQYYVQAREALSANAGRYALLF